MKKAILWSLVLVLVMVVPACRSTKKPVVTDTAGATTTVPDVPPPPPPPTDTATRVEPQPDFVQTDEPKEEVFPTDIEEANRFAQSKGYIRDAFFNYDEGTLDDAAQANLSATAAWLKSAEGMKYNVLIEGHCDERGTEQYNLALGDRRANTARDYLSTLGIDGGRMRTVSYGEERPFEEGHDDASWAQNRRAHIVLVR
jgi:peptidoglycan-associated lipoprotein